ncbi:MAG: DUF4294 domain-containing protein [Bacteroidia bacterium]|nr:DUF4294 domain-containing protein [Bacteroidia bacterium]
MRIILFFIIGILALPTQAQTDTSKKETAIIDGDTVTLKYIDPVLISQSMDASKIEEYQRLKRRVKKVMPYAKLAAYKMQVMEDNLALKKGKKERKKYIKQCEQSMKDLYMSQLKDLTIEEGKILMKLIHRETGQTTWEIMKTYRGTSEAIFWQAFGSVYGHDMKEEYDPVMDYQIEHIIKLLHLE